MGGPARRVCLGLAGVMMATSATAQTIRSANITVNPVDTVTLTTAMGDDMVPLAPVVPLTGLAGTGLPPTGLTGSVFLTNATSAFEVSARHIATINCDPVPGELQADYMFEQAISANASAVLFYSPSSETCTFSAYEGGYMFVYAMQSRVAAETLLEAVDRGFDTDQALWAQIALSDTIQVTGENDASQGFGGRDLGSHAGAGEDDEDRPYDNPLGSSPTTAVAMIILYAITGVITTLFLVIIVTGAIRAHRHPERYGPRDVTGRPRQSRAKGIARAMLDTLPIVKFGQRNEAAKPADVELAEHASEGRSENWSESTDEQNMAARGEADLPTEQTNGTSRQADDLTAPPRQSTADEGIAAAVSGARRSSQSPNPDNLGCSICTEDFEAGQDQRVLPCDHRFHPDCVDPWLLNVSGTCPLCRIDLHPPAEEPELDEHGNPVRPDRDGELGLPPLGAEGEVQRMSVRRSLLIGLVGSRGVDRMSREERLAALRQYGARQRAAAAEVQPAEQQQQQQADETRVRSRLRRVLGVRTRRTEE